MKPRSDWEIRFGAKRRAIDKALLEECERSLQQTEVKAAIVDMCAIEKDEARAAIARAFGRPLTAKGQRPI